MFEMFSATFAHGPTARALSDEAWRDAFIQVEVALAQAANDIGAISGDTTEAIAEAAKEPFSTSDIAASARRIGNPIAGVLTRFRELIPAEHHDGLHFHTTSQDILDTAMMLVARNAVDALRGEIIGAIRSVRNLSSHAGESEIMARTLLQQATPIRVRDLFNTWATGLEQAHTQLGELEFPVSYSGPVGTHPRHRGKHDIDYWRLNQCLALHLDLQPAKDWHTLRYPVVRIASASAEAAGACGKVATDIILLSQNEIGEVSEAIGGASTSMPHKHNPVAATSARANAARTPGLLSTLYAAMPQELQRSSGLWHSEWESLSDLLRLTGSSATWLGESVRGLQVHPEAMQHNVNRLHREDTP